MRHSYIDEYSNIDSFIHRLDPRIKIVAFFSFILFVIFTPPASFMVFGLYAVFMAGLILLSKVPFKFILKRSLVIIPFVLMIAVFIPFFKKGEVAGGYSFGSLSLTVSYDGLMVLWNVFVKAYLCSLSMILLISSTKLAELLKAFERLRCPLVFTMILSFMYRYIFVITDELMKMHHAKQARTSGGSRWFHTRVLANMIGVLFMRAYERGELVYLAMCSRGFEGKIKTMSNFCLNRGDIYFLLLVVGILAGIRIIGS